MGRFTTYKTNDLDHPCMDCDVEACEDNDLLECDAFRAHCHYDKPRTWCGEMQGRNLRENPCNGCDKREAEECSMDRGRGHLCKRIFPGANYKGAGRKRREI